MPFLAPYKVNRITVRRPLPTTNTVSQRKKWNKQKLNHLEFQQEITENTYLICVNSAVNENRTTENRTRQKWFYMVFPSEDRILNINL